MRYVQGPGVTRRLAAEMEAVGLAGPALVVAGNAALAPTAQDYAKLGVTGVDSAGAESLLGSVIDAKPVTAVDSVAELQALADAAAAVVRWAEGGDPLPQPPTEAQLELLGLDPAVVTPDRLPAILDAIADADPEDVDTLADLGGLVDEAVRRATDALAVIAAYDGTQDAAGTPTEQTYRDAGVDGVTADTLGPVNSVVAVLPPADTDTAAEVQALVGAYAKVLEAADGARGNDGGQLPTAADYKALGLGQVDSVAEVALLGDVLDGKAREVNSAALSYGYSVRGDRDEFGILPGKYNVLVSYLGTEGVATDTGDTLTYSAFYVTPRWALM